MKTCSNQETTRDEVGAQLHKPCAGGFSAAEPQTPADADGFWFVAVVKRHCELRCHEYLSRLTDLDYQVESYVASQDELVIYSNRTRRIKHHIVIPGKIFIRVDESCRKDLLRQCPLISHYMKDPARPTVNGFTDFMHVPDKELGLLREILDVTEEPVEYVGRLPKTGQKVQVLGGSFHGLKGQVVEDAGRKYAIVTLDSLGSFRFRLPVKDLAQIITKD